MMPGGLQLKTDVLTTSACALCGACLNWCPYLKNLEDHLVLRFDCPVNEGRCYSVCPRTFTDWQAIIERYLGGISYDKDIGAFQSVHRVKSVKPVGQQQDGGTVTALLQAALEQKLVDGVLITSSDDGFTPRSFLTNDAADIAKAAGSRFLASPGLGMINEAKEKGMEKLALVGRPCQVQAVRKMQFNQTPDRFLPDILTIGLFCMWSLSWSFKDYLARTYPGLTFSRMTIPQQGVELFSSEGIKHLPLETVQGYIRPGCSYCLDMTSELADIAVGAFEPEPGWNTVLVRTERGRDLLERAQSQDLLEVEEYPPEELDRLRQASHNKKARNLKHIQQAAEEQKITPFIDLSQSLYQDILAEAPGKEGL